MVVTFIAYWGLGLGSGYWLAFHGLAEFGLEPMGAEGLWTGLIIRLSGAAVALIVRLRYISQKHSA
jgi:MATE family multidrug resistance protein